MIPITMAGYVGGAELAQRAGFNSAGASMSSFGVEDITEDSFVYDMKLLLGDPSQGGDSSHWTGDELFSTQQLVIPVTAGRGPISYS